MNMHINKPATLSSSLVAVKGQAVATQPLPPTVPAVSEPAPTAVQGSSFMPAPVGGQGYFKAMTLKLDKDRFMRLKQLGLNQNKTSQVLLVEAVDLLLSQKP